MLVLIRKLREAIHSWTAPTSRALVVQPAYEQTGTFTRLVEHDTGVVRGTHYKCDCGQEHTDFTTGAMRGWCACKREFDLLRSLGGRPLAVLPTRALAIRRAQQPNYVVVGEGKSGDVSWSGAPPSSGVQWR